MTIEQSSRRLQRWFTAAAVLASISSIGTAHAVDPPPQLGTLRGLAVPGPSSSAYNDIVADKRWLVVLGKALFWDANVGSTDEACATCHWHAGADARFRNSLNPGILRLPMADDKFGGLTASTAGRTVAGAPMTINTRMWGTDFPFHRLSDERNRNSSIIYTTNDVLSSSGTFDGIFQGIERNIMFASGRRDVCGPGSDGIFRLNVDGVSKTVRKVEPRHTPTVINAAFNYRNFWDGRANNVFNGVDPFGRRSHARNPAAKVVKKFLIFPTLQTIALDNMSLASQAVGPPNSSFEMACAGRVFGNIGRRLFDTFALAGQKVDPNDSVFGASGPVGSVVGATTGLKMQYWELIHKAIKPDYWSLPSKYRITPQGQLVTDTVNGFTQKELNFALIFGLALDAYQRTLISDQTRYDDFAQGNTGALSDVEKQGLELFSGKGKCIACHNGPEFTNAATGLFKAARENGLVERMIMGDNGVALYDQGFYNIGVNPVSEDLGVGDVDIYGFPLSFARQYTDLQLQGRSSPDRFSVNPCTFEVPFNPRACGFRPTGAAALGTRLAVDGAFKTPTLRNIGLTPPYFHNGGYANLKQVMRFYNRGGNRRDIAGGDTSGTGPLGRTRPVGPNMGGSNLDADIQPLGLTDAEEDAIIAFLLTLSDTRVACHAAPFDHPELLLSHGHAVADANNDGRADDLLARLQAVGRSGYPSALCDSNRGDISLRSLTGPGRMAIPLNF